MRGGSMKKAVILITLLLLIFPSVSRCDDYEDIFFKTYLNGDYQAAMIKLIPLAEKGDGDAQSLIGTMYHDGLGVPKDYKNAMTWYQKASNASAKHGGDTFAQYAIGRMYSAGAGVQKNDQIAVYWYKRAANKGVADAQKFLGMSYAIGKGLPEDYVLAYMWLNLAASQSDLPGQKDDKEPSASDIRTDLERDMTPDQIAEAQKLAREWKPKK